MKKLLVLLQLLPSIAFGGAVSIPAGVHNWEIFYNGVLQANKAGTGPQGSLLEYGAWSALHVVKIHTSNYGVPYSFTSPCASIGQPNTSNWYISYNGGAGGSITLHPATFTSGCGAAPAVSTNYTTYSSSYSYTNLSFAVQTVTLTVNYNSNRVAQTVTQTLEPGEVIGSTIYDTNSFTWSLTGSSIGADGFNDSTAFGSGTPSGTTSTNPPSAVTYGNLNTSPGDFFGGAPSVPSAFNPFSSGITNQVRSTTNSTELAALVALDYNNNVRQSELVNVMLNLEKEQWRRDAAIASAAAQGTEKVASRVATLTAAVQAMHSDLGTGTDGSVTNYGSLGTNGWTAGTNFAASLKPTLPSVTVGSATFTIPLGALGVTGLADQSWNFGGGDLGDHVSLVRNIILAFVTVGFVIATYSLIGRIVGI